MTVKTSDARKHLRRNTFQKSGPEDHAKGGGIIGMNDGEVMLGVPAIEVKPMYTPVELSMYGVQQRTEVKIPLFSAAF